MDSGYCPPLKRREAQKIYIRKIGKKTQNFLHWANFDLVLGLHEAWIFLKAVMGRKLLLIWEIPHSIIQFQRVTGVFYKTENNSCNQGPLLVFCCTVGNWLRQLAVHSWHFTKQVYNVDYPGFLIDFKYIRDDQFKNVLNVKLSWTLLIIFSGP